VEKKNNNNDDDDDDDLDLSESSGEEDESGKKPRRDSWILKQKKGLASHMATSSAGKQLLKKYLDKDTQTLLTTVKKLITSIDTAKRAKQFNKDIIKIAVKVIVLYQDKKVTENSFESLKFTFRRICSAIRNNWRTKAFEEQATCDRLIDQFEQFEKGLLKILKSYVSQNSVERIRNTFGYVANTEFLQKASRHEDFDKVAYVMAVYLE